ncbi:hypothetical protein METBISCDRAFT_26773 [Metschnikowia bicuspidata]|uniref:Uncharacterized protein n=1 Tax=Metschnikowia bicuspidata TaxID=27322 RepID=A0A4P9ZGM5_9ASCO|nr:hypothetical protein METBISCDRAFT_26773 [Metschnikowia bicuspidata]
MQPTFKVRRVTSGLLPQQHVARYSSSAFAGIGGSGGGAAAAAEPERCTVAPTLHSSEQLRDGFCLSEKVPLDRSPPVHAPQPGRFPQVRYSLVEAHHTTETQRSDVPKTMLLASRAAAVATVPEAERIRLHKLISDDNVFSPQKAAGRGGARPGDTLRKPLLEDLEFDPSDCELPPKMSLAAPRALAAEKPAVAAPTDEWKPSVDPPGGTQTILQLDEPHFSAYTPRNSSPLRRVQSMASADASGDDAINTLYESSALQPKTTKEIFEQINNSIERFRESELDNRLDSLESDQSEREVLRSLDTLLPAWGTVLHVRDRGPVPEDSLLDLGSPVEKKSKSSRNARDSRDARDSVRTRNTMSINTATVNSLRRATGRRAKYYKTWTAESWRKLEALVQLPIPNAVIINSRAVQTRLGCDSKEELARRVQFLVGRLKKTG